MKIKIPNTKECYAIGNDNFTLGCIKILIQHNFIIKTIYTINHDLITWAEKNNIPVSETYNDFEKRISKAKHGFLFSLLNERIIPTKVLNKEEFLCINYHNALLPKYAGLNATSWALMNGETQHGITWHIMADKIDQGAIIKQGKIKIDVDETALSLNLKCADLGSKLFIELVRELTPDGLLTAKNQNLEQRTYFTKIQKPDGNALITWRNTAEEIDRLVRACDHAYTTNEFSLPKIFLSMRNPILLVKKLSITGEKSTFMPGVIVNLSAHGIQVSTKTNDILISELSNLYGKKTDIAKLVKEYDLSIGKPLPSPSKELCLDLKMVSEQYSRDESVWINDYLKSRPSLAPEISLKEIATISSYDEIKSFNINQNFLERGNKNFVITPSIASLALIIIYFQKITDYEHLSIGLVKDSNSIDKKIRHLFFNFSWLEIDFEPGRSFRDLSTKLMNELKKRKHDINCLKDSCARYPLARNNYVPPNIAIAFGNIDLSSTEASVIIKIEDDKISVNVNKSCNKIPEDQYYLLESISSKIESFIDVLKNDIDLPVYKLPLFNNFGRTLYTKTLSGIETNLPISKNLSELFEDTVLEHPDKASIQYESKNITYRELNEKANYLALFLIEKGVKPCDKVGVTSISSIETVIFIIAILKAGATYVPIDPAYPEIYLESLLNELNLTLILSKKFDSIFFETFIYKKYPTLNLYFFDYKAIRTDPKNLKLAYKNKHAYIMYTSGSSGKPKGVIVTQIGVIRLVINNNFLNISSKDVVSQASNLGFDASTFEIWGSLLNGALLICIDKQSILDPIKIKEILFKTHINVLWLTSSLFDQYVENDISIFSNIEYLLVGGDVINTKTVAKVLRDPNNKIKLFINGYGPTENTTFTTTFTINRDYKIGSNLPIGKPISNTKVYVVDKYFEPVGIGIPGELVVSGLGLSDGYISDKEQDIKKFVENKTLTGKFQRYYKTGDYVKWLEDGNLAYLGRKDEQVKLRGFRVELNTIKTKILAHEKVSQCLLMPLNGNQLFSYIVLKNNCSTTKTELLNFLKNSLPFYMIPTEVFFLARIPLNQNGKVDVSAIKSLPLSPCKRLIKPPTTETERILLGLWKLILQRDTLDIDDNFFEAGGNSLLISSLIVQVHKKLGFRLPISRFISEPTIASLASIIDNNQNQHNTAVSSILQDINFDHSEKNKILLTKNHKAITHKTVLVTGSTGFLGSYLVRELIKTGVKIICLVRANSFSEANDKLRKRFLENNFSLELLNKIFILVGDLSKNQLGLPRDDYNELINQIDEIYHAAATVNHIYGYDQLRADNVISTKNLLKILKLKNQVKFSYISTMSACFNHYDKEKHLLENFIDENELPTLINDGYSLTKWACEKLLSQMHSLGYRVKIYRPAWIIGDLHRNGMLLHNNHLFLLLKSCIQLGCAPSWNARINTCFVDELAKIIVKGSDHEANVFNIVNEQPSSWLDQINTLKSHGHLIEIINPQKWYQTLNQIDKRNAIFPLLSIYTDSDNQDWILKQDSISSARNENYLSVYNEIKIHPTKHGISLANYLTNLLPLLYGSLEST